MRTTSLIEFRGHRPPPRPSRRNILGFAACCAMLVMAPATLAEWTHLAGDAQRSGVSNRGPRALNQVAWIAPPQGDEEFVFASSPVEWECRVFVKARLFDGDEEIGSRLVAFDVQSGARLWSAVLLADVFGSSSTPAIDTRNETVLIGAGNRLFALDAQSGAESWSRPLDLDIVNASAAVTEDLDVNGTPANRVFITDYDGFGSSGKLYAINVDPFHATNNPFQPGEIAWTAPLGPTSGNSPAYADGSVVVASGDGAIRAFDAQAGGTPLWTWTAPSGFFGGVAIAEDAVFAASYEFNGGANNSELAKINLHTGAVIWSVPAERTSAIPVVCGDGLIVLSGGIDGFGSSPKLQAFEDLGASAALLWDTHADTSGALVVGGWANQPAFSRGRLYSSVPDPNDFYGANTALHLLDATLPPTDPGFIVATHVGSGGSPAISGGKLFSIGDAGLAAFQISGAALADLDGDCLVGPQDLALLLSAFLRTADGDLDGDCVTAAQDLALLLSEWGQSCP